MEADIMNDKLGTVHNNNKKRGPATCKCTIMHASSQPQIIIIFGSNIHANPILQRLSV